MLSYLGLSTEQNVLVYFTSERWRTTASATKSNTGWAKKPDHFKKC